MKFKWVTVQFGKITCLGSVAALAGCVVLPPANEQAVPAAAPVAPVAPAAPRKVYVPPAESQGEGESDGGGGGGGGGGWT